MKILRKTIKTSNPKTEPMLIQY